MVVIQLLAFSYLTIVRSFVALGRSWCIYTKEPLQRNWVALIASWASNKLRAVYFVIGAAIGSTRSHHSSNLAPPVSLRRLVLARCGCGGSRGLEVFVQQQQQQLSSSRCALACLLITWAPTISLPTRRATTETHHLSLCPVGWPSLNWCGFYLMLQAAKNLLPCFLLPTKINGQLKEVRLLLLKFYWNREQNGESRKNFKMEAEMYTQQTTTGSREVQASFMASGRFGSELGTHTTVLICAKQRKICILECLNIYK